MALLFLMLPPKLNLFLCKFCALCLLLKKIGLSSTECQLCSKLSPQCYKRLYWFDVSFTAFQANSSGNNGGGGVNPNQMIATMEVGYDKVVRFNFTKTFGNGF